MDEPAIEIRDLSFRYRPELPEVLRHLDLRLLAGQRCLLVGANGAGKTTLLRVLAGQHMLPVEQVRVLGRPAFHDTALVRDRAFLGGRFAFDVDVPVRQVVRGTPHADAAALDPLVELLGIDLSWSMRFVSDGQRRRVQILLALLRRPRVLLLDEVTTDLDVIARQDLLAWLRRETEERGACILYATHILDGLEDWATQLAYLDRGRLALQAPLERIPELVALRREGRAAPLLRLVEGWLRRDRLPGGTGA